MFSPLLPNEPRSSRITRSSKGYGGGIFHCPPKSHSRKSAFRYTQLDLLLALFGFTRQKQHSVVFDFATHSLLSSVVAQFKIRRSTQENNKKDTRLSVLFVILGAEAGFEPRDLRVMSPTSYQAALLRDI